MKKLIKKRDGRQVAFDQGRILRAVTRAMKATGEYTEHGARSVTNASISDLRGCEHGIEDVQDSVERSLVLLNFPKTVKAYILYRDARAKERERTVPVEVQKQVSYSSTFFKDNPLGEFVFYCTYSRWREDLNRRETWPEAVARYVNFMRENLGDSLGEIEYKKVYAAILNQEVMPSMRLLWSAGDAARATNVCAYNCAYTAITAISDLPDILYLLMCGTGVGFSVESKGIAHLPIVEYKQEGRLNYVVRDSREGWADALRVGLAEWYRGADVEFDYSQLRPAGAILKTMGGRSSGAAPLRNLLNFTKATIQANQGKRLRSVHVHDIICKMGEGVQMGGVRRSALLSLSDLEDVDMRKAKQGQFYNTQPQRAMANNSVAYDEQPTTQQFLEEWLNLVKSGSGERGIFNREAMIATAPRRREFMDHQKRFIGTNPCGEIVLRSKQFCNLTEVVARRDDTKGDLYRKAEIAALIGTYQATLTNFPYINKKWHENCCEERLLGVSITGMLDCDELQTDGVLEEMRERAIRTNQKYAERFDIPEAAAITCIKPSGNVSQLVNASSGMHPRHAAFYIRRVRIAAVNPLFKMMKEQGMEYYPEVGQDAESASTYVVEFPIKAPDYVGNSVDARHQLEWWLTVKQEYTEHNPSVTISVLPHEWISVAHWLYEHWNMLGGLSFLPREGHVYKLAPYEEITEERYLRLLDKQPEIDYSSLVVYEQSDMTEGSQELACGGGVCV